MTSFSHDKEANGRQTLAVLEIGATNRNEKKAAFVATLGAQPAKQSVAFDRASLDRDSFRTAPKRADRRTGLYSAGRNIR